LRQSRIIIIIGMAVLLLFLSFTPVYAITLSEVGERIRSVVYSVLMQLLIYTLIYIVGPIIAILVIISLISRAIDHLKTRSRNADHLLRNLEKYESAIRSELSSAKHNINMGVKLNNKEQVYMGLQSLYRAVNSVMDLILKAEGLNTKRSFRRELQMEEKFRLLVERRWAEQKDVIYFQRLQELWNEIKHAPERINVSQAMADAVLLLVFFDNFVGRSLTELDARRRKARKVAATPHIQKPAEVRSPPSQAATPSATVPTGQLDQPETPQPKLRTPTWLHARSSAILAKLSTARTLLNFDKVNEAVVNDSILALYKAVNATISLILEAEGLSLKRPDGKELKMSEKVKLLVERGWIERRFARYFIRLKNLRNRIEHSPESLHLPQTTHSEAKRLLRFHEGFVKASLRKLEAIGTVGGGPAQGKAPTPVPTQGPPSPLADEGGDVIGGAKAIMRILAEVPVLSEAQAIPGTFEELDMLLEDEGLLKKVKERIAAAMEGSVWQYSDPFEGVLTFGLAVILLSQVRDERLWVRWAKAEARRVERFLNEADDEILKFVWAYLGIKAERCAPEEEEKMGLPYKIHSSDYLRLAKTLTGSEWLNMKRLYWDGWVYVTRSELIKLILNEVKSKIVEIVEKIPKVTDQRVAKAAFELRSLLMYIEYRDSTKITSSCLTI
jgi:uncharacterized ubiquitin-like protein YukD